MEPSLFPSQFGGKSVTSDVWSSDFFSSFIEWLELFTQRLGSPIHTKFFPLLLPLKLCWRSEFCSRAAPELFLVGVEWSDDDKQWINGSRAFDRRLLSCWGMLGRRWWTPTLQKVCSTCCLESWFVKLEMGRSDQKHMRTWYQTNNLLASLYFTTKNMQNHICTSRITFKSIKPNLRVFAIFLCLYTAFGGKTSTNISQSSGEMTQQKLSPVEKGIFKSTPPPPRSFSAIIILSQSRWISMPKRCVYGGSTHRILFSSHLQIHFIILDLFTQLLLVTCRISMNPHAHNDAFFVFVSSIRKWIDATWNGSEFKAKTDSWSDLVAEVQRGTLWIVVATSMCVVQVVKDGDPNQSVLCGSIYIHNVIMCIVWWIWLV